jgi:signal transduction histidine kinase
MEKPPQWLTGMREIPVDELQREITALADYLAKRHAPILSAWSAAIQKDPTLTSGDSLPRSQLVDHVPALLSAFERSLRRAFEQAEMQGVTEASAAAHGQQRWQQGYDLGAVTREWGKLNECLIAELDRYAKMVPAISLDAMRRARQIWTRLCSEGIEASVNQYFMLQQQEAAGHVKDLESALHELRAGEQERSQMWQQAAHDLRGNLGVVANVSVGLTRRRERSLPQDDSARILLRNVTSIYQLLEDMTNLARLQAGRETRQIEPLDASNLLETLCEDIRPLATERGLDLYGEGPTALAVDGDPVKIRRIAQNVILNAVKYTRKGRITVRWGNSTPEDSKRWMLCIQDTGPGFHTESGRPLAAALEKGSTQPRDLPKSVTDLSLRGVAAFQSVSWQPGEGIGLSIVKRLCEMLDATLEMHSVENVGTTFKILFPRQYAS